MSRIDNTDSYPGAAAEVSCPWGLYIHIPFCARRCNYCGFFTGCLPRTDHAPYLDTIYKEYQTRREAPEYSGPLRSLYIGGGTPSVVDARLLVRLLGRLREATGTLWHPEEVTIEVNPEDVSAENVAAWRDCGVTRVSIGVQSFVDEELRLMGRRHDAAKACQALDLLVRNFSRVSLDLITGVPGQTLESVDNSLRLAIDSGAGHVSAYTLGFEPHSVMTLWRDQGKINQDEDLAVEMMLRVADGLEAAGIRQYEISNFARPGERSLHNSSYWTGRPYLGLGPSAHSYDGLRRRSWNPGDFRGYMRHFSEQMSAEENNGAQSAFLEYETLDDAQLLEERVMLSLRMKEGISIPGLAARFGQHEARRIESAAMAETEAGYLECSPDGQRYSLTRKGLPLADAVTGRLLWP